MADGMRRGMLEKREVNLKRLEKEAPNLYNGFHKLMKCCYEPGGLDRKQKEWMAIAATVASRCIP